MSPLSVNHNLMAWDVSRQLSAHYDSLADSVRRLSTGLRVERAADDAAGLAIRELMRADIKALGQGARNANDAISMIQTADGALQIIDEKLIRMKELAEQAATGTYDSTQRLMIDSEFQQMASEIDRIAKATEFNGVKLLDGSLSGRHDGSGAGSKDGLSSTGALKVHFGTANDSAEDYYYVEIGNCTLAGLGLREGAAEPVARNADAAVAPLQQLTGEHKYADIGFGPDFSELNDFADFKEERLEVGTMPTSIFKAKEGKWYVGCANGQGYENALLLIPAGTKNFVFNQIGAAYATTADNDIQLFTRDGKHLAGTFPIPEYYRFMAGQDVRLEKVCDKIGFTIDEYDATYVNTGPVVYDNGETLSFTSYNGMNIGFSRDYTPAFTPFPSYEILTIDVVTEDLVIWLPGIAGAEFKYYTRDGGGGQPATPGGEMAVGGDIISIKTQELAQQALSRLDNAIVRKDEIRAHLGATQNRLENTVTNLNVQAESLQAAESRISDVDVATEMTTFVRNQVLTQSATSMLAQANAFPHMLLQLLQG